MEKNKSCCSKTKDGKKKKMIMLCCLIPILLVLVLPFIGVKIFSGAWVFFLLCPLLHVGMMFFMKDHNH